MIRAIRTILVATLLLCPGCVEERTPEKTSSRYLDGPPSVRVLILESADTVSISIPEGCWIVRGKNVLKSKSRQPATVTAKKNRIRIGDKDSGFKVVSMVPPKDAVITIDTKSYAGRISFMADGSTVSAINTVDIEEYLPGVVAGEVPLSWDDDVLCAQAVAARSYALYERDRWSASRAFDLYADERSQMYVGVTRNEKALRAVSATRGVVLVEQWKIVPAFYHSACGGGTRRPPADFEADGVTPLAGVACSFCDIKDTRWQHAVTGEELRWLLQTPGPITQIKITEAGDTRHVTLAYKGGSSRFTSDEFRRLVGPKHLRNWRFRVERVKGKWVFSGKGFGHGVGLCQWGACGMAKEGYGWPSILRFYYPGSEALRVY